jgi:hypothetical protein
MTEFTGLAFAVLRSSKAVVTVGGRTKFHDPFTNLRRQRLPHTGTHEKDVITRKAKGVGGPSALSRDTNAMRSLASLYPIRVSCTDSENSAIQPPGVKA